MRLFAGLLIVISIGGCSLSAPPLPQRPPVDVSQLDRKRRIAYAAYMECAMTYAKEMSDSSATATEVSGAALIACRFERAAFAQTELERLRIRPEAAYVTELDLMELAEKSAVQVAENARGAALRVLIELRRTPTTTEGR